MASDAPQMDASATVIPFPRPKVPHLEASPPAVGGGAVESDRARLARALGTLRAALAEQRAAMEDWRRNLDALQSSAGRLGEGLSSYHSRMGHLREGVAALNQQAVLLEARADAMAAKAALAPAG